jgi:hypothetical protein
MATESVVVTQAGLLLAPEKTQLQAETSVNYEEEEVVNPDWLPAWHIDNDLFLPV